MVTATTTRREVFFSFFMFTANLQPNNAAYTEVLARHIRETSSRRPSDTSIMALASGAIARPAASKGTGLR